MNKIHLFTPLFFISNNIVYGATTIAYPNGVAHKYNTEYRRSTSEKNKFAFITNNEEHDMEDLSISKTEDLSINNDDLL